MAAAPGRDGLLGRDGGVGLFHALAPLRPARAHRLAQRRGLDLYAQAGDVLQVFGGDGRDAKAALPLGHHQRVAGQPRDGLAQRTGAHAVARLEVLHAQLFAGHERVGHDVVSQLRVGVLDQRAQGMGSVSLRFA